MRCCGHSLQCSSSKLRAPTYSRACVPSHADVDPSHDGLQEQPINSEFGLFDAILNDLAVSFRTCREHHLGMLGCKTFGRAVQLS